MTPAERLAKHLRRLYPKRRILAVLEGPAGQDLPDLTKYRYDPVGFCRDVLGVTLTPDQERVLSQLAKGRRVKVNSGHSLGKSFVAACAIVWWFYTRDPGVAVTTAPTRAHVETVLWTEVRLLIMRARVPLPTFLMPKAPKLYDHPDHWAEGITAASREGFHGRHRPNMLFVFDEAEGVDAVYWNATDTMYIPGQDHAWLAIGNPYTTSTQSYLEDLATDRDGNPKWDVISLSALNHPNIRAELDGLPPVVPNAVSVHQVDQWVHSRCTPVDPADVKPRDVEWPPARPCPKCRGARDESIPSEVQERGGPSHGLGDRTGGDTGASGGEAEVSRREWRDGDRLGGEERAAGLPSDVERGQAVSPPILLQRGGGEGPSGDGTESSGTTGPVADQRCPDCDGSGVVGGGKWWRPGPWFLAACMGVRPTGGIDTVWGEDVWTVCVTPRPDPRQQLVSCWLQRHGVTIGVDASGYGDDDTVFHVRSGPVSLHHEAHNGWSPGRSAGRLKELCREYASLYDSWATFPGAPKLRPEEVVVVLEGDGGYGIGIHSHRDEFEGWRMVTVGSSSGMISPTGMPMYYNTRSEIWCEGAALGAAGLIDLSRLPPEVLDRMKIQLLTPFYEVRGNGCRFVESKDEVKKRLRRSPDDADAFLLSHHRVPDWSPQVVGRDD